MLLSSEGCIDINSVYTQRQVTNLAIRRLAGELTMSLFAKVSSLCHCLALLTPLFGHVQPRCFLTAQKLYST